MFPKIVRLLLFLTYSDHRQFGQSRRNRPFLPFRRGAGPAPPALLAPEWRGLLCAGPGNGRREQSRRIRPMTEQTRRWMTWILEESLEHTITMPWDRRLRAARRKRLRRVA
jgi:hypothetical protein